MLVCLKHKKEMKVILNGVGVRFGDNHVYPGDMYKCPLCEHSFILTNSTSIYDPDHKIETIQMDESNE